MSEQTVLAQENETEGTLPDVQKEAVIQVQVVLQVKLADAKKMNCWLSRL